MLADSCRIVDNDNVNTETKKLETKEDIADFINKLNG